MPNLHAFGARFRVWIPRLLLVKVLDEAAWERGEAVGLPARTSIQQRSQGNTRMRPEQDKGTPT